MSLRDCGLPDEFHTFFADFGGIQQQRLTFRSPSAPNQTWVLRLSSSGNFEIARQSNGSATPALEITASGSMRVHGAVHVDELTVTNGGVQGTCEECAALRARIAAMETFISTNFVAPE